MAKRRKPQATEPPAAADVVPPAPPESQIFTGGVALHDLFQQQVRRTLDDSDLDEDAKQAILVAMNCPCCGAGGINYTAKIRRRT
jgi:hypothetical protein